MLLLPGAATAAELLPSPPTVVGFGLAATIGGALALYLYGRHWRRRSVHQAEDAVALRLAYAELEAAKRHAEAQTAQTRATLTGMSDGLMVLDAELRLVQWNERFAEITGVPTALLRVGTPMEALLRGQAEAGEFGPMPTREALASEVARRMEGIRNFPVVGVAERIRPNGHAHELRRSRLPDGGMISLYTDITARKRAEAAERAAHRAAEAGVAQQRRLLSMVSHEIRVPLEALIGSLALLDPAGLGSGSRALVETARRSASALRNLVTDILDLTRLEAGQFVLRRESVDLAQLLADVADIFRAAAAARGLVLRIEIAPDLPAHVFADPGRLRQVAMNMVSNAAKYADPGTVRLRADAVEGELRIAVHDPGPAIPAAEATRLFLPFERLESAEAAGVPGTGLGLAISARLARLMGGRIGLAEEAGGNLFWFTVPLATPSTVLDGVTAAQVDRRPLRRARILLVEDVAANRNLTAALLRRDGHRVDMAESGVVAVRMAAADAYDLVLMDIHMPGIDGVEAATRIRRLPPPAGSVPIVALTGSGDISGSATRPGAVMAGVLTKPVAPELLEATLRRIMEPAVPVAPPRPAEPAPGDALDRARIAELHGGLAPRMFATLVEQCLDDIGLRLPDLAAALARGAMTELGEVAHALAGMADGYGLAGIARRMRAVMQAGASDAAAGLAALVDGAEAEFARDAAAIRQYLRTLDDAAARQHAAA